MSGIEHGTLQLIGECAMTLKSNQPQERIQNHAEHLRWSFFKK